MFRNIVTAAVLAAMLPMVSLAQAACDLSCSLHHNRLICLMNELRTQPDSIQMPVNRMVMDMSDQNDTPTAGMSMADMRMPDDGTPDESHRSSRVATACDSGICADVYILNSVPDMNGLSTARSTIRSAVARFVLRVNVQPRVAEIEAEPPPRISDARLPLISLRI